MSKKKSEPSCAFNYTCGWSGKQSIKQTPAMCAQMALLLFHCHSPVAYVFRSTCTTLIFNSLLLPLITSPECSLALSPAFCYPSLIPLSLLPKRVLKCHSTDLEVSGTVKRTDQKCHGSFAP